ncbi:MAG: hypothetical protein ACFB6R_15380 [Alphaproteobacteria bacterium]
MGETRLRGPSSPPPDPELPGEGPEDIVGWAGDQALAAARSLPAGYAVSAVIIEASILLSESRSRGWRAGLGLVGTPVSLGMGRRHGGLADSALRLTVHVERGPGGPAAPSPD